MAGWLGCRSRHTLQQVKPGAALKFHPIKMQYWVGTEQARNYVMCSLVNDFRGPNGVVGVTAADNDLLPIVTDD
jgi:hypothetical protein